MRISYKDVWIEPMPDCTGRGRLLKWKARVFVHAVGSGRRELRAPGIFEKEREAFQAGFEHAVDFVERERRME